ncbi:MAG: GAF domain-containing sensor histidine kinase [Oscillochloris sp.]|nr:GAF domain-containing sensor histidine kinase [Oscillochloris sp.]
METFDLTAESIAYARELRDLYRSAERRAVRFRLLVEMGRDLVHARDLEGLLRLALVRATTFSGYERGSVFLRGPDGSLIERAALGAHAYSQYTHQHRLNADALHTIQVGEPLVVSPPNHTIDDSPIARVYLPLISNDGQPLGVLLLLSLASVAPPDRDDLDALQLLASQLAAAIQSVLHHENESNLVAQLTEREERRKELLDRLIGAQEEERRRIAYELHDGLGQMMLGALQQLHTLADLYRPRSPRSRMALERAIDMVQASVTETRRVIAGLRPTALDDFGLATAIRIQISALQSEGWNLRYDENLGERRLSPALEATLFRISQEALSNIRKHADTTQASITLNRTSEYVELSVRDSGCGFSLPMSTQLPAPGLQVGLLGIQERARLLGGQCRIESQIGHGTLVWVSLPLPSEEPREPDDERTTHTP